MQRIKLLEKLLLLAAMAFLPFTSLEANAQAAKAPCYYSDEAVMDCALYLYAEPGNPYMHKLLTKDGDIVTGVTGLPTGLQLKTDRTKYKYVSGTAPTTEGIYTYTVHLTTSAGVAKDDVTVTLNVSSHLTQPRPFMGLLTWNSFENHISTEAIKKLSDALNTFGLKDIGYRYMCIDDHWAEADRTDDGKLAISESKFSGSFDDVVGYIHNNGQKIGIYSDAGTMTCAQCQPGSYGYEESDAAQFVGWGFDLLKYDYCNADQGTTPEIAYQSYKAMGDAIATAMTAQGKDTKDFLFYMCEWGQREPWLWGAETGATCWRATLDTREFWDNPEQQGGILQSINTFKNNWGYQGVNRWNDADMLMVGLHGTGYSSSYGGETQGWLTQGFTTDESKTNFGLWCMWGSPLTLSNNITNLDGRPNALTGKSVTNSDFKQDLDIIRNLELIKLDQDVLGQGAEPIVDESDRIVFTRDLSDGDVAISVTNLTTSQATFTLAMSAVPGLKSGKTYQVLDLWNNATELSRTTSTGTLSFTVGAHGTAIVRLHDVAEGAYVGLVTSTDYPEGEASERPSDLFPVPGRKYYVYNTSRSSGTKLYWTTTGTAASLTSTLNESNDNMVWQFEYIDDNDGVYLFHIKNVGTGLYMGDCAGGGSNISLTSSASSAYAIEAVEGTEMYTFRDGSATADYLFADTNNRLDGWSNQEHEYFYLELAEAEPLPQCDKPEITFSNNRLTFRSATTGAQYHYTITSVDALDTATVATNGVVDMTGGFAVSVYATADGFEPSETASLTFKMSGTNKKGDVNEDGNVNVSDVTSVVKIILQQK